MNSAKPWRCLTARVPLIRIAAGGFVLLAILPAVGCGPDRPQTWPVVGTVTLDGQPVDRAAVMLIPRGGGRPATGVTDERGRFALATFEIGDGALAGTHDVTVTKVIVTGVYPDADGLAGGVAPEGMSTESLLPQIYADAATSGLAAEVKRGMGPLKLDLTTPATDPPDR